MNELRTLKEFPRAVVALLPALVASEQTSYGDVNLQRGRIAGLVEPNEPAVEEFALQLQLRLWQPEKGGGTRIRLKPCRNQQ